MKHACGESRVYLGRLEYFGKMLHRSGAARGDQRHAAHLAYCTQLGDVETLAHAVARHAIEHDLARTASLRFDYPVDGAARRIASAQGVAGELLHAITLFEGLAIHAHYDALG